MPEAKLKGRRVTLRPLRTSDGPALDTILSDRVVTRYLPYRVRHETGPEFVARVLREQRRGEGFAYAVVRSGTTEPIGQIRLIDWSRHERSAELGYWLHRRWWGHGFATEAVRMLCRHGFATLGLHRITASVDVPNLTSIRVLEKAGFVREGTGRRAIRLRGRRVDVAEFGLLRGELVDRDRPPLRSRGAGGSAGLVVIIRGPMGAGKTTLLRGLARRFGSRAYALDTDAALDYHPQDPFGEHLETEWPIEVEILALHSRIALGRGLDLLTDPGALLTQHEVDRFLRIVGRSPNDPRVVLFRLTVTPEGAIQRKTGVTARYVRAAHKGWQPTPVTGEEVVVTDGLSPDQVLRHAMRILRERTEPAHRGPPRDRRSPRRQARARRRT